LSVDIWVVVNDIIILHMDWTIVDGERLEIKNRNRKAGKKKGRIRIRYDHES